jgi:hypothetical protein
LLQWFHGQCTRHARGVSVLHAKHTRHPHSQDQATNRQPLGGCCTADLAVWRAALAVGRHTQSGAGALALKRTNAHTLFTPVTQTCWRTPSKHSAVCVTPWDCTATTPAPASKPPNELRCATDASAETLPAHSSGPLPAGRCSADAAPTTSHTRGPSAGAPSCCELPPRKLPPRKQLTAADALSTAAHECLRARARPCSRPPAGRRQAGGRALLVRGGRPSARRGPRGGARRPGAT